MQQLRSGCMIFPNSGKSGLLTGLKFLPRCLGRVVNVLAAAFVAAVAPDAAFVAAAALGFGWGCVFTWNH